MKKCFVSLALAVVAILLAVMPVLAVYYVWISVTESDGNSYTSLALNMPFEVDVLVEEGFIDTTGLDTRVTDSDLNVLPHMLAEDKLMWVSDISANRTTQFIFWADQAMLESFPTITGYGGYVTIDDTAALEPGDIYMFQFIVNLNMAPTDGSLLYKEGAISFNRTGTDELTYAVTGGNSLIASSVSSSDYCTIVVYSDGTDMWITVDDVLKDTIATSTVPNTSNDWYLFQNNIAPAVYYYDEWIVTT